MTSLPPLSIYLITRNEADRLGRTLAAVKGLAAEIVVVDSGSTDETVSIATAHGARVIEHPFEGYGPQKRFAEKQCREDWLLNIDADEVVTPQLYREILSLFSNGEPPLKAYGIPIAEVFPGMRKPHRFAYSLSPVRLYHRDAGQYALSPVHDRVDLKPGTLVGHLKCRIEHFSVRSMGEQIAKLNKYTDMQVADMEAKGRSLPAIRLLVEFPIQFFKAYLGRRHCLYGLYGIATAINFAYSRHLRVAKHIERQRMKQLDETVK